jgi:hypothetical protein
LWRRAKSLSSLSPLSPSHQSPFHDVVVFIIIASSSSSLVSVPSNTRHRPDPARSPPPSVSFSPRLLLSPPPSSHRPPRLLCPALARPPWGDPARRVPPLVHQARLELGHQVRRRRGRPQRELGPRGRAGPSCRPTRARPRVDSPTPAVCCRHRRSACARGARPPRACVAQRARRLRGGTDRPAGGQARAARRGLQEAASRVARNCYYHHRHVLLLLLLCFVCFVAVVCCCRLLCCVWVCGLFLPCPSSLLPCFCPSFFSPVVSRLVVLCSFRCRLLLCPVAGGGNARWASSSSSSSSSLPRLARRRALLGTDILTVISLVLTLTESNNGRPVAASALPFGVAAATPRRHVIRGMDFVLTLSVNSVVFRP